MDGMQPGLTDLDLWSALVGVGMPPLVALVVSSHWRPAARAVTAAAVCVAAGLITTWLAGGLHGVTPVRAVLVVAMATFGSYRTWWHGSRITAWIEQKTSRRRPRRKPRRPRLATGGLIDINALGRSLPPRPTTPPRTPPTSSGVL